MWGGIPRGYTPLYPRGGVLALEPVETGSVSGPPHFRTLQAPLHRGAWTPPDPAGVGDGPILAHPHKSGSTRDTLFHVGGPPKMTPSGGSFPGGSPHYGYAKEPRHFVVIIQRP